MEQDKEHTWWDGCGWACAAYDCVADREQFAEDSRKEERLLGTDGNSSHGTYNMGVILISVLQDRKLGLREGTWLKVPSKLSEDMPVQFA